VYSIESQFSPEFLNTPVNELMHTRKYEQVDDKDEEPLTEVEFDVLTGLLLCSK